MFKNKKFMSIISAIALTLSIAAVPASAADTIVTSPQINLNGVIADKISIISDVNNIIVKNGNTDSAAENTAPNNLLCTAPNIAVNGVSTAALNIISLINNIVVQNNISVDGDSIREAIAEITAKGGN